MLAHRLTGAALGLVATLGPLVAAAAPESPTPTPGAATTVIALPPLTPDEQADQLREAGPKGAPHLGFGRPLPSDQHPGTAPLRWRPSADGGRVARLRLTSPGAAGLRAALRVQGLPDAAQLSVGAPGATEPRTLPGALINASLRGERAASDGDAPVFWTPLVAGDSLLIAIRLSPGAADPDQLRLTLPRLTHLVRLPGAPADGAAGNITDTASDPACRPDLDRPSRASALLLYTDPNGATGACSGVMVQAADPADGAAANLLSAHHCLNDQPRASSIEAWFHLRAASCGGPPLTPAVVSGGADLIRAIKTTDTSLLRLRQPPPAGATAVEPTADLPPLGSPVIGVHHPDAGAQRLAIGTVTGHGNCFEANYCGPNADPAGIHYLLVSWTRGATNGGSSGSGLFLADGRLVGVLSGGLDEAGEADEVGGSDDYGRVGLTGRDAPDLWENPMTSSISRRKKQNKE